MGFIWNYIPSLYQWLSHTLDIEIGNIENSIVNSNSKIVSENLSQELSLGIAQ